MGRSSSAPAFVLLRLAISIRSVILPRNQTDAESVLYPDI